MNDLAGKTALVTGGTSGIGRAVALKLAQRAAHVVIVGRDGVKGEAVVETARAEGRDIAFLQADLSTTHRVRQVAQQFRASHEHIHMLVHSAGGHFLQRKLTEEGIEINFATNYLSKWLLSNELMPCLTTSTPARIVVVGSPVVNPKRFMNLEHIRQKRLILPIRALLISGLATAVWTAEFARRLEGSDITINIVDPGVVRTQVTREWPLPLRLLDRIMQARQGVSAEEGADAPLYLATSNELMGVNGQFFKRTKLTNVPPEIRKATFGQELWALSEQLTSTL